MPGEIKSKAYEDGRRLCQAEAPNACAGQVLASACVATARLYPGRLAENNRLLVRACRLGDSDACVEAFYSGYPLDPEQARVWVAQARAACSR